MTTDEARTIFDEAIAATTDPEVKATRELLREYFCNPAFRAEMHEMIYQINNQEVQS